MARVILGWKHSGESVDYFLVWRRQAGVGNFTQITASNSLGPNTRTFEDATVILNGRYDYRVQAVHTLYGSSEPTDILDVKVVVPPPTPVTELIATILP